MKFAARANSGWDSWVRWSITVGNIKAYRRTGDENDKAIASIEVTDALPTLVAKIARRHRQSHAGFAADTAEGLAGKPGQGDKE